MAQVQLMSKQEFDQVMGVNASWAFPGTEDGWYKAHDAIRLDLADMSAALETCVKTLESGKSLPPWVIPNLKKWWPTFEEMVHHHHDNEEKIAFPGLSKLGVVMPDKMSADHVTLMATMDAVSGLIKSLKPGRSLQEDTTAFITLQKRFEVLHNMMCEHLKEEEDIGLPLMRKQITHKQFKPVEKKIVASASAELLGWFLRSFKDDADRKRWMSKVAGIPAPVQYLVMLPAARKFRNNVARLILEVRAGEQLPKEHSGCF